MTTDLTVGNMIWYGKELMACDFDSMQTYTAEGEGAMINGGAYYPLYAGRLLEIVNKSFNPYDAALSAASLTVITPELAASYQKQPAQTEPPAEEPAPDDPEQPDTPEVPDEPTEPTEPAEPEDPFGNENFWTEDGQT